MQDYSYKKDFCSKTFEKSKKFEDTGILFNTFFFNLALVLEEKKYVSLSKF